MACTDGIEHRTWILRGMGSGNRNETRSLKLTNMEAEVITKFLADLVNATSDCVQAVSDQCLAKGLITRATYSRVLESGGISEDKARTLILSVQKSTKMDSNCFNILVEILDEQLPPASKQKLLQEMRQEVADRATSCKALVPAKSQQNDTELDLPLTVASLQCVQQQSSLLGRYENSVSRLAYTSAQKNHIEEALQSRVDESGRLKDKLEILEGQLEAINSDEKEIVSTKNRLSTCEMEMANLKGRIEELECIIEEESMRARRGRNTIRLETKRLFDHVAQQSQQEVKRRRVEFTETLKSKEREYQKALTEQEATIQRRVQEEANVKIRELEHKVALQEKELKIKEMELDNAKMRQERQSYTPPLEL